MGQNWRQKLKIGEKSRKIINNGKIPRGNVSKGGNITVKG